MVCVGRRAGGDGAERTPGTSELCPGWYFPGTSTERDLSDLSDFSDPLGPPLTPWSLEASGLGLDLLSVPEDILR